MASLIPKPSTCKLPGFAEMNGCSSASESSGGSCCDCCCCSGCGLDEDELGMRASKGWSSSMSGMSGPAPASSTIASTSRPSSESGGSSAASSAGLGGAGAGVTGCARELLDLSLLAPRICAGIGTARLTFVEMVSVFVLCLVLYLFTALQKSFTRESAKL